MTQQFKFGDMVQHPEFGRGVIVAAFDHSADVVFENHRNKIITIGLYFTSELELIPHPDTERLDWIEEEGIVVNPLSIPSITGDYDGGWELSSEYTNGDTFIYDMPHKLEPSLRECIDVAMQQEQTK